MRSPSNSFDNGRHFSPQSIAYDSQKILCKIQPLTDHEKNTCGILHVILVTGKNLQSAAMIGTQGSLACPIDPKLKAPLYDQRA